ncbi:MAG TPA: phage tail tape measure protein, partial [Candidatus Polarisedimenticolaceae bacterium]|nr:phage tail tape measure protein [Candidatus Polarisedimenticolaceae bacterium]
MRKQLGNFGNMARSAGNQIVNLGKNIQWSGRQLMVGFTYPMVLFGAAAGVMAYKVENAFGSINKVYDVSAAALESQALREKELGQVRVDSMEMATRVAEKYGITIDKTLAVEQQLAATGMKGQKLLSSTEEVQRISAIGDIEPTVTTEMVVALQTAFKDTIRDGEDLTNVLNFMNATSNATSLSLQDIAEATPRAASGLSQLGVTAEQMTIMLVSMREAGVQADEGANALKSATTRILNPAIVQKAQDLYKKAGASFNLKDIVDKSQGNLYDFIRMLGKATRASKDMSKQEKASAVAALFGTYQFNRLNAAIVNLGDAKAGENNQTSKAIALQQKSNEELASQAKISEDLMMSTDAAKMRKAWAEFQIELSKLGKPFLVAVGEILKGGKKLLEWFNGLSDTKKKFAMYAAGALALVGPVIMLTGLF